MLGIWFNCSRILAKIFFLYGLSLIDIAVFMDNRNEWLINVNLNWDLWVLRTQSSWDFNLNKWFQSNGFNQMIDKIESIGRQRYVHFFKARQLGLFTRKGSPMLGTSTVGKENFLTLYAIYTVIFNCDYSIWNVFIAKFIWSIKLSPSQTLWPIVCRNFGTH